MIKPWDLLFLRSKTKKLEEENAWLWQQRRAHEMRDIEGEQVEGLKKQNAILAERSTQLDNMMADVRRLRSTLLEVDKKAVETAEEVGTPVVDLAIWLLRGKPHGRGE